MLDDAPVWRPGSGPTKLTAPRVGPGEAAGGGKGTAVLQRSSAPGLLASKAPGSELQRLPPDRLAATAGP